MPTAMSHPGQYGNGEMAAALPMAWMPPYPSSTHPPLPLPLAVHEMSPRPMSMPQRGLPDTAGALPNGCTPP